MNSKHKFSNIIPAEIDSEIKLTKGLSMNTLIFLVAGIIFTQQFNFLVHPLLQLPYFIFSALVCLVLVIPSRRNSGKKMYQCILLSFRKNFQIYHSINFKEEVLNYAEDEPSKD